MEPATTILTLAMDAASFDHFDVLRREHYPSELNRIPAHISLFHVLPPCDEVRDTLVGAAASTQGFTARINGLKSLGRGVAFTVASEAARKLYRELTEAFADYLVPQDKQGFRPHIVVQNKTTPDIARATFTHLQADFAPRDVTCIGLDWWDYLGGPWRLRQRFPFT